MERKSVLLNGRKYYIPSLKLVFTLSLLEYLTSAVDGAYYWERKLTSSSLMVFVDSGYGSGSLAIPITVPG